MFDLRLGITIVEVVVAIAALMSLGDYLGYKIGRWRLVSSLGYITLAIIVLFAIYAAISLR